MAQILYYGSRLGCLRIPEGARRRKENFATVLCFQRAVCVYTLRLLFASQKNARRSPRSSFLQELSPAHSFLLRGMVGAAGDGMMRVSADLSWRGKRECQA